MIAKLRDAQCRTSCPACSDVNGGIDGNTIHSAASRTSIVLLQRDAAKDACDASGGSVVCGSRPGQLHNKIAR